MALVTAFGFSSDPCLADYRHIGDNNRGIHLDGDSPQTNDCEARGESAKSKAQLGESTKSPLHNKTTTSS